MKATSPLLYYHRIRPIRAYVFRNRLPRTREEQRADMSGVEFQRQHVAGDFGWTATAQFRERVYTRKFWMQWWGMLMITTGMVYSLTIKVSNPDIASQLPFPLGSNSNPRSMLTSGGTYNWDDDNAGMSRYAQGGGNTAGPYMQSERYALRLARAENAIGKRSEELAAVDAEVAELRAMMK